MNKPMNIKDLRALLELVPHHNLHANVYDNIGEWEADCVALGLIKDGDNFIPCDEWPMDIFMSFVKK